ncbi:MAG: hypothetical protein ACMUIM_11570 [bacterium]
MSFTCRVKDKSALRLIGRYLLSVVMIDDSIHPSREGVPQRGPLSPLLANILLDDLFTKSLGGVGTALFGMRMTFHFGKNQASPAIGSCKVDPTGQRRNSGLR